MPSGMALRRPSWWLSCHFLPLQFWTFTSTNVTIRATLKKMGDQTAPAITVRVIDYCLPGISNAAPVYRLITTLLDAKHYPADELAALYHLRWSIASSFAEIKTTLKGADIVLRSKIPEWVRQEFLGLLLAHHVVRKMMLEAALSRQRTPDVLSFKYSLTLIAANFPPAVPFPQSTSRSGG